MAVKITDLKKYLTELNEQELREEILKLFKKLKPVKEFYTQELMGEADRKKMLEDIKSKINKQFWTPSGNPKNANNKVIRQLISDFEKIAVFPYDLVDLILYRVEVAVEFADTFGGMAENSYDAARNAFEKAVKLMKEHQLYDDFNTRCEELFTYDNTGYGFKDDLEDIYEEFFPKDK